MPNIKPPINDLKEMEAGISNVNDEFEGESTSFVCSIKYAEKNLCWLDSIFTTDVVSQLLCNDEMGFDIEKFCSEEDERLYCRPIDFDELVEGKFLLIM